METADATYGSDKHGLVYGYLFVPGEPATPIDCEQVADWLVDPSASSADAFVWLNFSLSNIAAERWILRHLTVAPAFQESLHGEITSTRLEHDGDALIGVVHDVIYDFTFDPASVSTVSLCVEPRFLVSARLKPLRSVDRLRAAVKAGVPFRSSVDLLSHLMTDQADVLADIVRQSTTRVDTMEDQLLAGRLSTIRRDLGALRRTLVRLQRLLAPEPAALFRLLNRPPSWVGAEDLQSLRQAAEEFSAAIGDSGSLAERVTLMQEELGALRNEQTNRTLFLLTVVTVLALPVNLAAGLMGMNVGGIPFAEHAQGFLIVVLGLVTLTALLASLAWRSRR